MRIPPIALAVAVVWTTAAASADEFADARKRAEESLKRGDEIGALEAFTKAAAAAPDDGQKSSALEQAAYCAFRRRGQDPAMKNKAMELAVRIPLRPVSVKCRMILLREDYNYSGLIQEFKDEPIAAWQEADLAAEALSLRAKAYVMLKKGKEAETDMSMAVQRVPHNPKYRLDLAEIYRQTLGDNQRALELYRGIMAEADPARKHDDTVLSAAVGMAGILRDQAKYEQALEILGPYTGMSTLRSSQRIRVLLALGEIHAALGREDEAVAMFDQANELRGK